MQNTKFKVKIRDVLTYEGIKPPEGYGLFTRKGVEWLNGLGLGHGLQHRLMPSLKREILALNRVLRQTAKGDEDVGLLETVPGVGYYAVILVKAEIGDAERLPSRR